MDKHLPLWGLMVLLVSLSFAACDEDTGSMGIITDNDAVASDIETFQIRSTTMAIDSVVANTTKSYLGQVFDPETESTVKAEFIAQFHTFEDYELPDQSMLVKGSDNQIEADSVELRLYFTDYFGEGNNPMKLYVYELDRNNILREDETYYATSDLSDFVAQGAQPLTQKTFSPQDYMLTEVERNSTSHYKNVRLRLPKEWGSELLRTAYEHPEYFQDPWQFIHNVLPGLYFKLQSGMGTMLTLDVAALNVYFRYTVSDSTYIGISRFSATPEVIQSSSFVNQGLNSLIQESLTEPYTYVKTPAALITELTLPVDEVYAGHETDSIARARVILTRYNRTTNSNFVFGIPSELLILPKDELTSFFKNHQVADGKSSFTTAFASAYNTYTFDNIANLLALLYHRKVETMKRESLTAEQYQRKYPNWNKVAVVPVNVSTYTDPSSKITRQTSVTHDFSLSSIKLKGGVEPIDMQVIYSKYR